MQTGRKSHGEEKGQRQQNAYTCALLKGKTSGEEGKKGYVAETTESIAVVMNGRVRINQSRLIKA